ncbi:MAG: thiamine pyrophosphate-requiring protein [Pseudomonadota bacterium]
MEHPVTAGAALFAKLKALGVDYVFANSGTDFPPIIEGLIEARTRGVALPQALTIPHEHVAMGMAHGYTQITGRMQAVMLHTNVGLSNGATGTINAASDQIPMFVMSGRTPVSESGRFGARTVPIGWGQEMYDQSALVREACKWDYELRFSDQISEVLDRGWSIAQSTPKGPVYLSLPREVLCAPCPSVGLDQPTAMDPVRMAPDRAALAAAAAALAAAERPMILAQRGAGSETAFRSLTRFVEDWAIPVSHYWATQIAVALTSDAHVDWMPDKLLAEADLVLVIDALAPWWPDRAAPAPDATVIHLGPDPLFARSTPMRSFRSDITLAGDTGPALLELIVAVTALGPPGKAIEARRKSLAVRASKERARVADLARRGNGAPMTKAWVSHCLGQAIRGRPASVFHELGCPLPQLQLDAHLSYFQEPYSGGLGWGLPAAMGAQLADPARLVFATVGDGSYMFANPTVCHQVCEALGLPVITLVLNNAEWGAVRQSVQSLYADGAAGRTNSVPLTSLEPSPDFCKTAEASRAYTETVSRGEDLPGALERAIKVATEERRQVLLDIAIRRDQDV